MRQLRDDTHLILDGEVRVYRRERSKRWQAAFVIDGHTIRISTGKRDLAEAMSMPATHSLSTSSDTKTICPLSPRSSLTLQSWPSQICASSWTLA
jgi:hypothetical protein